MRLRVWFDGGRGMQLLVPDQRIAAVGYAMMAATVSDGSIDSEALAADAASLAKVSGGAMVASGGHIGVGTTTPQSRLDLGTGSGAKIRTYEDGRTDNKVGFGVDMSGNGYENSLYFGTHASGHLSVGSWDGATFSEKMRVSSDGSAALAGAIKLGHAVNPPPAAGMIRWTGTDFQGYDGGQWLSLTMPAPANMVLVPGGTFMMGCTNIDFGDSSPEHEVTISPYFLARHEVTYALWYVVRQWALANGYNFQNAGREGNDGTAGAAPTAARGEPVTYVSWRDCIVWCNARSEKESLAPVYTYTNQVIRDSRDANATACDSAVFKRDSDGYRLPTEAEWECAARHIDGYSWTPGNYASGAGGPHTDTNASIEVSWYWENSRNGTRPVGTKRGNQLGIYDMCGNVGEWCWDWYTKYSSDSVTDPVGPTSGTERTFRQGCWGVSSSGIESAVHLGWYASRTDRYIGLRCARNSP